ncbi:hypothetical protein CLHOM_06200 [Clostridium homopropionicum DSM 5847]|uniref:Polysaccharide deacetylase n=1 Tax=Clostridium homopropionicum DSM 5847 TaxID=1121318 RepID=A0A0L6ZDK4_9CLOT|nr:hypothetical protein [Clostridium homopropionicum]KOA21032.1 hypothetical protein CLHOM_06200 [Clostridium homopropionicum DSM 5847]SFF98957.1 hypothetical protein SAMN04488501_104100 [Clostridium homopropionicum]
MDKFKNTIYITLDVDWACDEVLKETIKLFNKEDVSATFFITHQTDLITELRKNSKIELGIHPNFNQISGITDMENSIIYLKTIVQEAKSVRTHSLMQSSNILDLYQKQGLKYETNTYIPLRSNILLKPYYHWNGILRIPFFWEDDVHCLDIENGDEKDWDVNRFIDYDGIKVFNFHPIHLFLNTENLQRYRKAKEYYHESDKLKDFINKDSNNGARVFLENLIHVSREKSIKFQCIYNISM